jgi:hypothetical protein
LTAVLEDLSLSWVTFGNNPDDCQWFPLDGCPGEPVAVAWWDGTCCDDATDSCRLCAPHRDELAAGHAHGCRFTCGFCNATRVLLRIEALR